jgi:hypothetical protein
MTLGSSGLLIAIIGYPSFAMSVLVWGRAKKKRVKKLVLKNNEFPDLMNGK